jgi:hypothetical protein
MGIAAFSSIGPDRFHEVTLHAPGCRIAPARRAAVDLYASSRAITL